MWWSFLERLIFPPAGPLIGAATGIALSRYVWGRRLVTASIVALFALSTPLVSTALVYPLERIEPIDINALPDHPSGAIVVLAGGYLAHTPEYEGGTVNLWSLERARYAARLHDRLGWPVLVTGGPREGEALAVLLEEDFDVPVLWVDSEAGNTQENANNTAALLGDRDPGRIVLVTKALHFPRALAAFERVGLDAIVPAPTGYFYRPDPEQRLTPWLIVPALPALTQSYMALHEYVGRLWYWIRYDLFG